MNTTTQIVENLLPGKVSANLYPGSVTQAPRLEIWGSTGTVPPLLNSALDGGKWSASHTCLFTPGETAPGAHLMGRWVGPRADFDVMEKRKISYPYLVPNFDSSVIQRIALCLYWLMYAGSPCVPRNWQYWNWY
jgi:hypothetical protein